MCISPLIPAASRSLPIGEATLPSSPCSLSDPYQLIYSLVWYLSLVFTLVVTVSIVSVVSFCGFFPSDQSVCVTSISFAQPFVQDPIQLLPSFPLSFGIVSPSIGAGVVSIYLATIVYGSSSPIGSFSASPSVHSLVQVFSVYYWSSTASAVSSASSSASLHFCPSSPRYSIVAQY